MVLSIISLKNTNVIAVFLLIISLIPLGVLALCNYDVVIDSNVEIEKDEYYVYTYNKMEVLSCKINEPIPDAVVTYDSAISVHADPILRHKIVNGKIVETSVGIYSPVIKYFVYLVGAGATYNAETNTYNNDSPFYLQNRLILTTLYGFDKCSERQGDGFSHYKCNWVNVYNDGEIWAQLSCESGCAVRPDGTSFCDAIRC